MIIILNSVDILLIIRDMMSICGQKISFFFYYFSYFNHGEKEEVKNGCDTYAKSFHMVHLVKALQYHEKMEELQKAFKIAKQLLQQHVDEKQHILR